MRSAIGLAVVLLAACAPSDEPRARSLEDDTLAVLRAAYDDARGTIGAYTHQAPLVSVTTATARDDDARMLASATVDGWRIAPELAAAFAATSTIEEHPTSTVERWDDVAWTAGSTTDETDEWTVRLSVPAFGRERRVAVVRCDAFSPNPSGSFGSVYVLAFADGRWEIVATPAFWIS